MARDEPRQLSAAAAWRTARAGNPGSRILGWKLDRAERTALLERFAPAYDHVVADHVTLAAKVAAGAPLPAETQGRIVGRADDGDGVEAMIVQIAGTTDRPDGSTYHVTWSLDWMKGRRAVESNDVIRDRGWQPLDAAMPIRLIPSCGAMNRLFLDCDGVLADFDRGAAAVLGLPPREFEKRHGLPEFWRRIARAPDFYATVPPLPDAHELFEAVRHLEPIILTGLPRGNWAALQKERWAAEHFPGTPIITCMAVDKRRHAQAGDILVDDLLKHRKLWEEAGAIFVHHRNAAATIAELRRIWPDRMPD